MGRKHKKFDAVAFSPDGRRLATGSRDKTARLWPLPRDLWPKRK